MMKGKVDAKDGQVGPCARAPRILPPAHPRRAETRPFPSRMCSLDARNGNHPRRPLSQLFKPLMPVLALLCIGILSHSLSQAADEGKEVSKEQKEVLEVVKKLQGRYEQTKDLQADFQQTTRIEGFATPLTSSGRFLIKKPGLLRWDYRDPTVEEIYVTRKIGRAHV